MDEVVLDGKTYVASKAAATACGYTQDYVGQLCRGGHIDARRVSGHWYINLDSIKEYKAKAETFKPEPPKFTPDPNAESSIEIEGKEYISAAKAAKITTYAQDYVGQLARASKIPSKQIGGRWYVEKEALLSHKSEKDALLAAVQAESVGLKKPEFNDQNGLYVSQIHLPTPLTIHRTAQPLLSYSPDDRDLIPLQKTIDEAAEDDHIVAIAEQNVHPQINEDKVAIPINVVKPVQPPFYEERKVVARNNPSLPSKNLADTRVLVPRKTIYIAKIAAPVFVLILIVVAGLYGFSSVNSSGVITSNQSSLSASAAASIQSLGDFIESILGNELIYTRN